MDLWPAISLVLTAHNVLYGCLTANGTADFHSHDQAGHMGVCNNTDNEWANMNGSNSIQEQDYGQHEVWWNNKHKILGSNVMVIQGSSKMAGNSHHANVWKSVFETEGKW